MITVGQLKELMKDVPDDIPVVVRSDYYYEIAASATHEKHFSEDPEIREVFAIDS